VLVTGGTTGIGRAVVQHLREVNARVLTFSREAEHVEAARAAMPDVIVLQADVAKAEDVERVYRELDAQLGGLDALVNNAGISGQSVSDPNLPEPEWHEVIHTNLVGMMHMAQEAVPRLQSSGGGAIVNVGSMSAKAREEGMDVYVATKSGLRGWSDSFGKSVAKHSINVTLLEPGLVLTELTKKGEPEDSERRQQVQIIEADDIARVVLFLLSQPSRVCIPEIQVRPRMQLI